MARVGIGRKARARDHDDVGHRIHIGREGRAAVFAAMAMNLRGAVEGVQVAALGPAKSAAWEDRKSDEGCALQPAANRAVAVMGLERRLRKLELVGAAVARARDLFEFG